MKPRRISIYRVEDLYGPIPNLNKFMQNKFKKLGLNYLKIIPSITRYEYDDSDFVSWHLYYGDISNNIINNDKEILLSILDKLGRPVFNVSGNGYGTGLSIMLPLGKRFDKD